MRIGNSALMIAAVTASMTLFTYTEANAACGPTDPSCAILGSNVITFNGAVNATCTFNGVITGCTKYTYTFTGLAYNQIVFAIPKAVMTKQSSDDNTAKLEVGCQQLYRNAEGDPTTGFGASFSTMNICRIPDNIPSGQTFEIRVDPSSPAPLSWQEKVGKNIYYDSLLGPDTPGAAVASTGETLTTENGSRLTYTISGGRVNSAHCVTASGGNCNAQILSLSDTLVCSPTDPAAALPADAVTINGLTCLPVTYVDGNPNFKTGEHSTCYKYIGSTPIAYTC